MKKKICVLCGGLFAILMPWVVKYQQPNFQNRLDNVLKVRVELYADTDACDTTPSGPCDPKHA